MNTNLKKNINTAGTVGYIISIFVIIALVFCMVAVGLTTVAAGLVAKEEVVGTFGVLYNYDDGEEELGEEGEQIWDRVAADFSPIAAYAFMIFNLLCAPCFAAIGAIKREMNNAKWTWAAIGYMTGWAYVLALIVYNIGGLIMGEVSFGVGTIAGIVLLGGLLYLLFRKGYQAAEGEGKEMAVKMTA
jgi:ferrous iron transport protein B